MVSFLSFFFFSCALCNFSEAETLFLIIPRDWQGRLFMIHLLVHNSFWRRNKPVTSWINAGSARQDAEPASTTISGGQRFTGRKLIIIVDIDASGCRLRSLPVGALGRSNPRYRKQRGDGLGVVRVAGLLVAWYAGLDRADFPGDRDDDYERADDPRPAFHHGDPRLESCLRKRTVMKKVNHLYAFKPARILQMILARILAMILAKILKYPHSDKIWGIIRGTPVNHRFKNLIKRNKRGNGHYIQIGLDHTYTIYLCDDRLFQCPQVDWQFQTSINFPTVKQVLVLKQRAEETLILLSSMSLKPLVVITLQRNEELRLFHLD